MLIIGVLKDITSQTLAINSLLVQDISPEIIVRLEHRFQDETIESFGDIAHRSAQLSQAFAIVLNDVDLLPKQVCVLNQTVGALIDVLFYTESIVEDMSDSHVLQVIDI